MQRQELIGGPTRGPLCVLLLGLMGGMLFPTWTAGLDVAEQELSEVRDAPQEITVTLEIFMTLHRLNGKPWTCVEILFSMSIIHHVHVSMRPLFATL